MQRKTRSKRPKPQAVLRIPPIAISVDSPGDGSSGTTHVDVVFERVVNGDKFEVARVLRDLATTIAGTLGLHATGGQVIVELRLRGKS